MASYPYPPQSGSIFRYKNKLYRVKTIDSDTESVFLELINDKGDVLNNDVPPIGRKQWDSRNYEEIPSKGKKENEGKENKSTPYTISFDPESGDIMIKHPDGIKSERIKGLKGKDGESVFSEWARKKGILNPTQQDWEDFINSLRGKDGQSINGKDAPSPYEEWLGRQPKDAAPEDKSYTAFIRSITGAKGKDGYEGRDGLSAFEVWKSIQPNGDSLTEKDFFDFLKGDTGKNGHEGVDGKDGDTWKPYVSEEGILYFENVRTGERTKPVNIKGLQGPGADKGANGDTWEPYFLDDGKHQLYFKNQKGETLGPFDVVGATGKTGPQGPRGESAYQIWLNEGNKGDFHDFLLWIAKQAQKGDNGKDGDTFRPHIEKGGHLFFISDKTGERIDIGWIKGDKGDQGETGLNGHNVTHKYGYKEIYDWTCPVQEINPHLIASSDDLASGGSAEKHMRETLNRIENLRKDGKRVTEEGPFTGNKKWLNRILYFIKNPLKEFFWWCSGADRPLLRMCPAEHSKYMGIGTVIFFTALMAMVSSLFAISYVFGNHELAADHEKFSVCVVFAFFWGLMIFFLDRFITNTMYSDGKVTISWLELRSALPRILISIFLGIVISAPLELKIFNQEINDYIKAQATNRFNEDLFNSDSPNLADLYYQRNQDSAALSDAIKNYQKTKDVSPEVKITTYVEPKIQSTINKSFRYVPDGKGDVRKVDDKTQKDTTILVYSETAYQNALMRDSLQVQKALRNDSISRSLLKYKRDSLLDSFNANEVLSNAGLYERLSALHAIAFHEDRTNDESAYKSWSKTYPGSETGRFIGFSIAVFLVLIIVSLPFTKNVTKGSDKKTKPSNTELSTKEKILQFWKGASVLWPWFAVIALVCGYCNNALFNALPYYIFSSVGMIMMLFILIDVSPVFYKMMLADGQYEQYLHKEKSITQDLVRLNFAKSIAKVNESEIGRLAPLIFSKPFEKIKEILQGSKKKESLEWTVDENDNDIRIASQTIRESNEEVFATVLRMKKAIIEASYQAWYRDMRDAIIGMHKPGFGDGGSGVDSSNTNTPPNTPPDSPSSPDDGNGPDMPHGHYNSEDEPFSRDNYYGNRSGTSPDYDASSDDPNPGTPEDILMDEETRHSNPSYSNPDDTEDKDDYGEESESDSETIETEEDFTTSKEGEDNEDEDSDRDDVEDDSDATTGDDSSTNETSTSHPDSDVEREVIDDDDDDTIKPR